jgi:hypothetical protein
MVRQTSGRMTSIRDEDIRTWKVGNFGMS